MDNEKLYETLRQFIKKSGYNNKRFALKSGINVNSFQTMLNRKSDMKTETALKVTKGMLEIIHELRDEGAPGDIRDDLKYLRKDFAIELGLYDAAAAQTVRIAANELCRDVESKYGLDVSSEPFNLQWFGDAGTSSEPAPDQPLSLDLGASKLLGALGIIMERETLLATFNQLNAEGRTKALERVQELTEIPRYQKEDEEPETAKEPAVSEEPEETE